MLMLGFFTLMSELSAPGLGVPGFISFLCFLLFFWAQFLNGTAGWLEVIMFLGGISCLAIELFIIPGMGVFGLGGGAMLIGSLVLASQTFVVPQNSYQLKQLPGSLYSVVFAAVGQREAMVDWSYLIGKRGVATTQLTPSGKARFGDEVLDVISHSELIKKNAAVRVAEVHGNRVVVEPLESPS